MKATRLINLTVRALPLIAICLLGGATYAEQFNISIGTVVGDGSPAAGAGRLSTSIETDVYRFTATAGQLVFLEEISDDAAFDGYLRWTLVAPGGTQLLSQYMEGSSPGRVQLDQSGTYEIRVSVATPQASRVGTYSFGIHAIPPDQTFAIAVGDTVAAGQPQAGAGKIETAGAEDIYTFNGTAGQLAFFEEISVDTSFGGWLKWQMLDPTGAQVFSQWFDSSNPGRQTLPKTGTYKILVSSPHPEISQFGEYSFRLRAIPPDQTFAIQVGDTVSDGVPTPGAGRIEVAGTHDRYTFNGTAGQLVYFEEISSDAGFGGWLQWQLTAPDGSTRVFNSWIDSDSPGRQTLPQTGTYTILVMSPQEEPDQSGIYSFRLRAIPPDQKFTIPVGGTVSDGVPAAGAGRIELPGAQDIYEFQGTAGQALFFEEISAAAEFKGWLQWNVVKPSNNPLFTAWFDTSPTGRKDLTETGTYRIYVSVPTDNTSYVGAYSFRIRDIAGDTRYPIAVGQVVSAGVPGPGAGTIESAGGQDQYKFDGVAGQQVIFEEISADATFAGWLRWDVKTPAGDTLYPGWFDGSQTPGKALPTTGTYTVRVFSGDQNPAYVGSYSFRLYSPVVANADNLAAAPGKILVVPAAKFLCNDTSEAADVLSVDVPKAQTSQGGTVTATVGSITYVAKPGFTGVDAFTYRLRGQFGGEDTGSVTVRVFDGADALATVVSVRRIGPTLAQACLLGAASHSYRVEESTDLVNWTFRETITSSSTGEMVYEYRTDVGVQRYFRFTDGGR